MKKKNYVYKLVCSGTCYDNLEAAARDAFYIMKGYAINTRLTNPIILKANGGYDVKAFTTEGKVWTRHIDVFTLKSRSSQKINVRYMSARHSSHWKITEALQDMVSDYEANREDDEEVDDFCFDCSTCAARRDCPDYIDETKEDEDEDEDEEEE